MNTLPRSSLRVSGSILVLCVLGTVGYVSALANQQGVGAVSPPISRNLVLAQGMGGFAGGGIVGMAGMGGMYSGIDKPKEVVIKWEKPTAPIPSWMDAKNDFNEIEEKIQRVLNERMEVDFDSLALSTIFKIIRGKFDIPIFIDERALEDENISSDERITLERPPTKICDVLTQILRPLELTYVVELEAVFITSKKTSANQVRYYDLSYFLPDNGLTSELITALEVMIYPDQWVSSGGTSSMVTVGSMLVISAPQDTHREVERLLRAISKQSPTNLKPRVFLDKPANEMAESVKTGEKS